MDQMTARNLILILGVLSFASSAIFIWAYHLFVEDMEGVQYVVTAGSLIGILVTVVFVRSVLTRAPAELPQDKAYKELPQDGNWRNMATRKLILKRKKTFVGSVGKTYVFLGDGQGEFVIKGIKCTEIGCLRNGDRGEYDIPTESVYVFVLGNKKYADEFHSCYQIPRGDKNVELLTAPSLSKNKFEIFSKQDLADLGKKDDL